MCEGGGHQPATTHDAGAVCRPKGRRHRSPPASIATSPYVNLTEARGRRGGGAADALMPTLPLSRWPLRDLLLTGRNMI